MTIIHRHVRPQGRLIPAEDFEIVELFLEEGPRAMVSVDGEQVMVTFEYGCWGTLRDDKGRWRPLHAEYALALQQAVRKATK